MPRDLQQFFGRLETSLLTLARHGEAVQLEKKLDDFEKLLTCWLEVAPQASTARPPFSFAQAEARFIGPLQIDLHDLIIEANASNDTETFIAIVNALTTYLFRAKQANQIQLYGEIARILWFAYYRGVRNDAIRSAIGDMFDRRLHSILSDFKARSLYLDDSRDLDKKTVYENERPYLDAALSLTLSLISTAMEEADPKYACYFFERLVEHRKIDRDSWPSDQRAPSVEDQDTLHDYAILTIASWALHLLEERFENSEEAARKVLELTLSHLPTRQEIVALWELYQSGSVFRAEIDERLGTSRWDLRDKGDSRVGVSQARSGGGEWRKHGFYAALLRAETGFEQEVEDFFTDPPSRFMWDASRAQVVLEELSSSIYLGVAQAERDGAISTAVDLLKHRQDAADAAYQQYSETEPLDPKRCEKLRNDVIKSFARHQGWYKAIKTLGGATLPANFKMPPIVEVRQYVPRDYLIPKNSWADGFGGWVGEEAAKWESVRLVGLVEEFAETGQPIRKLAEMPEVIRDAKRELVNRGYEPNLLIIPNEGRFAGAVFRKPLWQVEEQREFGNVGYGVWEGLHVLRFPYIDPVSIIIADARQLFGTVQEGPIGIEVSIRELTTDELEKLVEQSSDQASSEIQRAKVLVTARVRPLLGIAKREEKSRPDAAIALDVKNSDGAYAMRSDDSKYHRPSCREIESKDDVEYSLVRHLPEETKDRDPCDVCYPERWNAEGRRG